MEPVPIGETLKPSLFSPPQILLTLTPTRTSEHSDVRGVPLRYCQWTLADYHPGLVAKAEGWAASNLWSLYLTGVVGTRKSSFAAAILHGAGRGYFATPEKTVEKIRGFCKWWIDQAKTCSLLVVDDLGSYRATPHVHDTLLAILATRYDNFRKTIITSNASLDEIEQWLDARLADRLREGLAMFSGKASKRESGNPQAITKQAVGDYLKDQKPKFTGPP